MTAVKRQLVAEQWDSYVRQVLPMGISAVQKQETRRAFYAGAQAIMYGVIGALAPDSEPTAQDLQMMDDLEKELSDFAEAVKAGRA